MTWSGRTRAVVERRYDVEERMMLHADIWRGDELLTQAEAINDIVLARGRTLRTVQVSVQVDGHYVMTQNADGMIVSTPTGSTAYCLSAGGPIVAPDLDCMTITPVAPHLSMAHAIVMPPHRQVCLSLVAGRMRCLAWMGRSICRSQPGDRVVGSISERKRPLCALWRRRTFLRDCAAEAEMAGSRLDKLESAQVMYCVNHPKSETLMRCSKCLEPICPKCAVRTPVGLRCPKCAWRRPISVRT